MNVIGHGIDVVDIKKFHLLVSGDRAVHLNRYFTSSELEEIGDGPSKPSRIAGKFSAKEAAMKAVQHGFGDGVGFCDIETKTSEVGAPFVVLHRKIKSEAEQKGIKEWFVSITHSED